MAPCEYAYNINWFDSQKLDFFSGIIFGGVVGAAAFVLQNTAFFGMDSQSTAAITENRLTHVYQTLYFNGSLEETEDSRFIYRADEIMAIFVFYFTTFYICELLDARVIQIRRVSSMWKQEPWLKRILSLNTSEIPQIYAITPAVDEDGGQQKMVIFNIILLSMFECWLLYIICEGFYNTFFPFVSQEAELFKHYNGVKSDKEARTYATLVLVFSGMGILHLFRVLIDSYKYIDAVQLNTSKIFKVMRLGITLMIPIMVPIGSAAKLTFKTPIGELEADDISDDTAFGVLFFICIFAFAGLLVVIAWSSLRNRNVRGQDAISTV